MHPEHITQLVTTALQCTADQPIPIHNNLIVTLSSESNPEIWVSIYGEILDFSYTSQQPPQAFAQGVFTDLPSWQLIDWSPGRIATVEFHQVKFQELSRAIYA